MVDFLPIKPTADPVSYDLGWLIQNEKVSDEELCRFLVNETSFEIERLISLFLKSPADQIAAVDQIISTALLKRRSYKGNISGKAWLYQLILEECLRRVSRNPPRHGVFFRRVLEAIDTSLLGDTHLKTFVDSLADEQRLFVILYYGQDLAIKDIAFLLKIGLEQVQTGLEQFQHNLIDHQMACKECASLHSNLKSMEMMLVDALHTNSRLIETARENSSEWVRSLLDRVVREKVRHRARIWASRAAEIGLGVLLLVLFELAYTDSWPVRPWSGKPTATNVPMVASSETIPQPEPIATAPSAPVAKIESERKMEDILTLSLTSWARWQTLWANVQVKNFKVENSSYGSMSTLVQTQRKQIWLSLSGSARVLSGKSTGNPDISYSILNGQISGQNHDNGQTIERSSPDLIPDADLQKLFSPADMFSPGGQFTWSGSDSIAGRPAWVVDWYFNDQKVFRYWIDQDFGVVLRRLEYGQNVFKPIISEITVTKIFIDASFPAEIFEPFRYRGDHFANDFSGDPEIDDFKAALQTWSDPGIKLSMSEIEHPAGNSYSSSQLSFQYVAGGWMQGPDNPALDLFADQVDLGRLPLRGKAIQTCERSPDGSRIAYNSPPIDSSGDTALLVADLASIQSARPALAQGITSGDFAFSPDNQRLAFFGCEKGTQFCGIFILDLASWKLTRLTPLNYADYLMWSPDGRSIALVGKDDRSEASAKLATANLLLTEVMALLHTWHFQVIDANSGDVTYKRAFDWSNLSAPPDSPTNNWDTVFKIPTAGVNGCIKPPQKTGNQYPN